MRALWRWVLLVHRYLGIAVGVVVLLWCASAVVMMYVPYPAVDAQDQLAALAPLQLEGTPLTDRLASGLGVLSIDAVVLERWQNRLLMRVQMSNGAGLLVDAGTGQEIETLSLDALRAAGDEIARYLDISGARFVGQLDSDQWTVHGRFDRHRPLLQFAGADGQRWYLSSSSGELVQFTTASQRFWNWLGAVVHWIYPTLIRQNTALWAQLVIWLTILSLFLTLTGIAYGIRQFRWRGRGRRSPYTGWGMWHHYSGLLFGLFTLTWLVSGLFSMNPWGALEGRSFAAEFQRYKGAPISLTAALVRLREAGSEAPEDTVRLVAARRDGDLTMLAYNQAGAAQRLGSRHADGLTRQDGERIARLLRPHQPVAAADLLAEHDAYYYSHHDSRTLPVLRIRYTDGERFYIDPATAEIVHAVDSERAWYRWLFNGLHAGDFHPFARARPVWDIWMLLLIGGLMVGSASGVVLAWRRIS